MDNDHLFVEYPCKNEWINASLIGVRIIYYVSNKSSHLVMVWWEVNDTSRTRVIDYHWLLSEPADLVGRQQPHSDQGLDFQDKVNRNCR